MTGECYFCNGLVLAGEHDHLVLDDHADHEVYMHRRCAADREVLTDVSESSDRVEVTCPGCGAVETTHLSS